MLRSSAQPNPEARYLIIRHGEVLDEVEPRTTTLYPSAPPAPTLASAIFTPGPIVELREIFFK